MAIGMDRSCFKITASNMNEFQELDNALNVFLGHYLIKGEGTVGVENIVNRGAICLNPRENGLIDSIISVNRELAGNVLFSGPRHVEICLDGLSYRIQYSNKD